MDALNKKRGKIYWFLRQYGYYILLGLILLSTAADYLPVLRYIDVLSYVMSFAMNILGWPITKLWGLIFNAIF